jgi:hypothetical protein
MTPFEDKLKAFLLSPEWQTHQKQILALPNIKKQANMFEDKVKELFKLSNWMRREIVEALITFVIEPIDKSADSKLQQNLATWLQGIAARNDSYYNPPRYYTGVDIHRAIMAAWFTTRNPTLETLILENTQISRLSTLDEKLQIYVALKKNQDPFQELYVANHYYFLSMRYFEVLEEASLDKDPQIAATAKRCIHDWLAEVTDIWLKYRHGLEVIKHYFDPIPTPIQVLLTLEGPDWENLTAASAEDIPYIVHVSNTSQEYILANIRYILENLEREEARQALCSMITKENWPIAEVAAVAADYRPTGLPAHKQSLYYFLTEQWERYEEIDFDGRLLARAYQAGNSDLHERLLERIRLSGQSQYLEIINSYHITEETTAQEVTILIEMLAENKQWEKLWQLALSFNLEGSVTAIQKLAQAGWRPQQNATQVHFEQLKKLASSPLLDFWQRKKWEIDGVTVASKYGLLKPLSQINLAQLSELNRLPKNQEVSQAASNTLRYIETVLNYRFQDGIELGETFEVIPSKFDIEIEG